MDPVPPSLVRSGANAENNNRVLGEACFCLQRIEGQCPRGAGSSFLEREQLWHHQKRGVFVFCEQRARCSKFSVATERSCQNGLKAAACIYYFGQENAHLF